MIKELLKGSAIYGIAPFVPRIISVILLPILTRYMTSTDYGIIGTITAITMATQAFQELGLTMLLTNHFYKCREQYKVFWREIYGFLSLWMVAYACIQAALLYFFIPEEAADNKWLIIILANFSTVFFGPTSLIGRLYYQLNLRPGPVAIRLIISGIISLLTNFLCVVVFRWGYMGAYVGTFASTFIINCSYWPVVNRRLGLSPIYNFKWRTIRRSLKIGLPTIPNYYSGYLMNSTNVVAMNVYNKPQSEIGCLSVAQSITNIFSVAIDSVNRMFTPLTYQMIRNKNSKEISRLLYTYLSLVYSLTFLYSLWSRETYGLLISNEEIALTYKYSIILAMALCYRPMYVYCVSYFFYFERTIQILGICLVAGLISCGFYFTMIPVIGIYAALIGFYLGCIYMGYSGYFFSFYKTHRVFDAKWYLFLLIQLTLTGVAYVCVDLHLVIKICITLFYIFVLGIFIIVKIKPGYVRCFKINI
jgi:O-antigen/teichoic acid export membrane protein